MLLNSELKEIQTLNKDFSNGTVIEIEFREFSICGADYSEWICMEGEWIGHLPQCESGKFLLAHLRTTCSREAFRIIRCPLSVVRRQQFL